MTRFKWHKIEELQNEIVAFAFRDCDQGWRSEVEEPDPKTHPDTDEYYGSRIFIKETRDGGETWAPVHVGDHVLDPLRYQAATGRLWAIKVVAHGPVKIRLPYDFSLVVSDDGGRHWREYCALPHGMKGFELIDDRRGYAWTSASLHATADGGEHWRRLARIDGTPYSAPMEAVGADGTFYFIRDHDRQVFAIDPWQGIERAIPLPEGFTPRMLSVAKADNRLFILGRTHEQWKLILLEDHRMIGMSDVPADSEWRPVELVYDNGVLNLICRRSNPSFSPFEGRRNYFLAMDGQGWDIQALSGKTRFHRFGFAGTCAWGLRISLLRGVWEVWRRTAEPAVTGNDGGDCWTPMDNSGSQAPAS